MILAHFIVDGTILMICIDYKLPEDDTIVSKHVGV